MMRSVQPPRPVTIGGRSLLLYPLTLHVVGQLVPDYIATMRRQALLSTDGLGSDERDAALASVTAEAIRIDENVGPVIDWIGTPPGMTRAVQLSLSSPLSIHEVAAFTHGCIMADAGDDPDAPIGPIAWWLFDSGLGPDPTKPPLAKEPATPDPDGLDDVPSPEPSSTGTTG